MWSYLCIVLLTFSVASYPSISWRTSPFTINPSNDLIEPSVISIEGGSVIIYTVTLRKSDRKYMLFYRWNATADPPTILATQTGTFVGALDKLSISLLANNIRVSYFLTGSTYFEIRLRKSDLAPLAGFPTTT